MRRPRARQLSSPGAGITRPVWPIIAGAPGQSGVGVVTRGRPLSTLVGLGRPRDGPGRSAPVNVTGSQRGQRGSDGPIQEASQRAQARGSSVHG